MSYVSKIRRDRFPRAEKGTRMEATDGFSEEELIKLREAIGEHESDGIYTARGQVVKKGRYKGQRALGKYQVMPGNLAQWSKETIGRVVTEKEFLENPKIQDEIVTKRLRALYKSYEDPRDVASVWFSGRPFADNKGFDGFQSVAQYVNEVTAILNRKGGWGGKPLNKIDAPAGSPSNTASGDPYPKGFKSFKGKDGTEYPIPQGLNPATFYKDPDVIKALKEDKTFNSDTDAVWGPEHEKAWKALGKEKQEALVKQSQEAPVTATTSTATTDNTVKDTSTDYTPVYQPIASNGTEGPKETPYGKAYRQPTTFSDVVNLGSGERKRGYLSPLALEQIAPELLTMATNKRDPVNQQMYQPELKQTFDISYQLGRNENQASFNSVAKIAEMTGNMDALSQLAAQKYQADQQYNMQEVQGNAQQKLQTYNANVDTLNDARLKNLALIADQQAKQAQADFNTRREDIGAFTSIAGKKLQNDLENKTYNAYANLFQHYGFDKNGNVTFQADQVVKRFNSGEAQQFGMLAAQKGAAAIMNGDFNRQTTRVKNEDGSTTSTETLGRNRQIQDRYKTLKAQGYSDAIIGNILQADYPETISKD